MKGQKLFISLLTLVSLGFVSSCKNTSNSTNSNSGSSQNSGSNNSNSGKKSDVTPEEDKGLYAEEDAAHVAQAYKGAFSSGEEGVDHSTISGAERASILGDMEAWGLKNHILGIPLFGDGGWTLMNPRVQGPIGNNYVANYGFGFEREGKIISDLTKDQEANEAYRSYLHEGLSEFNGELNQFDSNNSASSSLLGYISGSLFGQRLVKDGTGGYEKYFEWYSSMADGDPVPVDFDEETKTATTWRVKFRSNDNLTYHTNSTKTVNGTALSSFEGTKITAKDFVNSYRIMLNGNCQNSYASQYATRFVGASDYYKASASTKVFTTEDDELWDKVGIKLIDDDTIEFQFKSECTKSYAMMELSIYPTNESFFKLITEWDSSNYNSKNFGKNATIGSLELTPLDTLLCSGAYTMSKYDVGTGTDNEIVYTRNDTFIDRVLENNNNYEVYAIKGYVFKISSAYGGESGTTSMYNDYLSGKLDTASIPTDKKDDWSGEKAGKYITGNTAITSLQVNSTTAERWQEVFGKNGTNWENQSDYTYDEEKAKAYTVKPVMSNSDFLDGIYFSIDRQTLADSLMANPSSNWLAEAYVMDVNDWVSYDDTAAHKRAVKNYSPETYGYSRAAAQAKFKKAMEDLTASGAYTKGTESNPTVITISLQIAAEKQRSNWATKVKTYIEECFNTSAMLKEGYKLVVDLPTAPATVSDVYGILASGCYDLIWGGISGGTADALGMAGCWVDSWDYGLQMSVGVPTNVDTGEGGIIHDGYSYSFEAMFLAVEYGEPVLIENGAFIGLPEKDEEEEQ